MKYIFLFLTVFLLFSCGDASQKTASAAEANVDSLLSVFVSAWNSKDSVATMSVIAEDAVVINDSLIYQGKPDIASKWVSGGLKVLTNISALPVIKSGDEKVAYSGGTYAGDLTPPGGPKLKEKGNYSFGWSKQSNGEWKLTLLHIEDISRMPDIK